MAVITVADVLRRAEEFEGMLADYYARLSERAAREGVRMLADYMSRHRVRIAERLDRLTPEQVRRIGCTPLRYEPQGADCRCFDGVDLPADVAAAQVLDAAVTFNRCLIKLYQQAAQQPVDQEVRELFEGLIRSEEHDEIEMKKIKAMDYF